MEALRATTHAAGTDLRLDTRRLAAAVLAGADLPDDLARRLEPVALWWAAGGDDALPSLPEEGEWLDLGAAGRARLRPWSERQRFSALSAALSGEGDDTWFDPVTYLDGMVRASLQVLDGPQALDDMDARGTAVLLHATVALNLAGDQEDPCSTGAPPPVNGRPAPCACARPWAGPPPAYGPRPRPRSTACCACSMCFSRRPARPARRASPTTPTPR
jgi:hypothetical protein